MSKQVLLIGGTGVLSQAVCNEAVENGWKVTTITRGNRKHLLRDDVVNLFEDITNQTLMKSLLDGCRFDVVVDFLVADVESLINSLSIIKDKCSQYIFISSATVYTPTDKIIDEDSQLGNDEWEYSRNKLLCEKYLKKNYKKYVDEYTIIRPYVTYSEQRIPSAIAPVYQWSIANRILYDKPLPMWDGGSQQFNITYAGDFASGVVGLFLNQKAYGEDFHITSSEETTWYDITEKIAFLLKKNLYTVDIPSEIMAKNMPGFRGPLLHDKNCNWRFDNSKIIDAVSKLRFNTTIEQGLPKIIGYYMADSTRQKIDYAWDGEVDNLIKQYVKSSGLRTDKEVMGTLNMAAFTKEDITLVDKLNYLKGRNAWLRNFVRRIRADG